MNARLLAAGILAFAAIASTGGSAHAQSGARSLFAEAFRPDIMQRDLDMMRSVLALEEWQQPVMEALLSDYMTSFNTGVQAAQERMKQRLTEQAAAGDRSFSIAAESIRGWSTEKAALTAKFLDDVKSQLGPTQLERWPAFERALRRERMLPEGELSGETVDVLMIVNRMQPTSAEEQALQPVLERFEVALDEALQARTAKQESIRQPLEKAIEAKDYDRQADLLEQGVQAGLPVRAANEDAIAAIAAAFGERGAEFRRVAMKAAYPDVFRPHPVMTLMEQARKLDSITDDQGRQIDDLMREFQVVVDEADARVLATVREEEPKAPRRRAAAAAERRAKGSTGAAPKPVDPVVAVRSDRDRAGDPFRERLMAILTEEQRAQLPGGSRPQARELADDPSQQKDADHAVSPKGAPGDAKSRRSGGRRDLRDRTGKGDDRKAGPDEKSAGDGGKPLGQPLPPPEQPQE
jgi:hypothetical protein